MTYFGLNNYILWNIHGKLIVAQLVKKLLLLKPRVEYTNIPFDFIQS
jgi:hypothetical protein